MVISSQQNNQIQGLFNHRKHQTIGFLLALVFSSGLMVADYHYRYLDTLRSGFSVLVSPLQYTVDYPVRIIGWVQSLVSSKKALVDENIQLRYKQAMLESKLQKLMMIRHENSQLKELLNASYQSEMATMAAQILAVDTGNTRQLLVIDKGSKESVYQGQPVLDAKGVLGQVIRVSQLTSTVLLVTDSKSGVPVQNNRTGERAILVGTNRLNQLSLINLPKTSSILPGDMLVTSGMGRKYPEGYPVGTVSHVKDIPGEEFITVEVSPVALLNRNRLVLLVWPDKKHAQLSQQIDEQLKATKNMNA